jgi:hypothetical protein
VLVVQTVNSPIFEKILRVVLRRFEDAEIELAIRPEMEKRLPKNHDCRLWLIDRDKRAEFIGELKSRYFDTVVVGWCAQRGFWKLKLLPFLLGPRRVLVYNENADSFFLNRRHLRAICHHLKWRIVQRCFLENWARDSLLVLVAERIARFALAGPAFFWLLLRAALWERKRRRHAKSR